MDYFAYQSKRKSVAHIKEFIENTPSSESSNSMPSTPTIFIHDAGKSPSKPTCIRYSASFFHSETAPSSALSTSLPSPPTTPHHQLPVLPTLSLSLPSPSKSFRRRFSNPPHTVHSPRLHVLLVDDNAINLQILSRMLNLHLSAAIEHMELVKSGVKALEILKCRPFDLILMDIDMPILNGIETTKHIRSSTEFDILPRNRKAPIVAVTTNDSSAWRATYKEIGMNGCIGKPISPNDLKKTLSRILDLHLPIPPYTPE